MKHTETLAERRLGASFAPLGVPKRVRAGEPLASSAKLFLKRWKHLNDRDGSLQGYLHSHNLRCISCGLLGLL